MIYYLDILYAYQLKIDYTGPRFTLIIGAALVQCIDKKYTHKISEDLLNLGRSNEFGEDLLSLGRLTIFVEEYTLFGEDFTIFGKDSLSLGKKNGIILDLRKYRGKCDFSLQVILL